MIWAAWAVWAVSKTPDCLNDKTKRPGGYFSPAVFLCLIPFLKHFASGDGVGQAGPHNFHIRWKVRGQAGRQTAVQHDKHAFVISFARSTARRPGAVSFLDPVCPGITALPGGPGPGTACQGAARAPGHKSSCATLLLAHPPRHAPHLCRSEQTVCLLNSCSRVCRLIRSICWA